jgi:hypothetical protein
MKVKRMVAIGGLAAAGGGVLLLRLREGGGNASKWAGRVVGNGYSGDAPLSDRTDLWHTVTVNRQPEEIPEDRLPEPLAGLGDRVEVRTRPAPKDFGTELSARWRRPVPTGLRGAWARVSGEDPREEVRYALRAAKSILEAGEVLRPDEPSTTKPTPAGKLLGAVTSRARGEGLL